MENLNGGTKEDFRKRRVRRINNLKAGNKSGADNAGAEYTDGVKGSKSEAFNNLKGYLKEKSKGGNQEYQGFVKTEQLVERLKGAKSREEIADAFREIGECKFDADMWYDIINALSLDVVQNSSEGETEKLQLAKDRLDLALETVISESMVGTQVLYRLHKESIKYGDDVRDKESEAWPIEAQGIFTASQTANAVIERISNKEWFNNTSVGKSSSLGKFRDKYTTFNHGVVPLAEDDANSNDSDGEALVEDGVNSDGDVNSGDDVNSLE